MNISSRWVAMAVASALAVFATVARPSDATVLKIATSAPDGTAWMKILRQAGTDVAITTEGRVKLKFYPAGTRVTTAT